MPKPRGSRVPKRRFPGGTGRAKILQEYDQFFKRAKRVVGHGRTTSNVELEKALDKLGIRPSKVCTECDVKTMKSQGTLPTYVISNTMCGPPGQHWIAYYKGYKYDPLGKDSSKTAEQNKIETNCGQRCIAYLEMCKKKNRTMTF